VARGLTRAGDASSWTLVVLALLATLEPAVTRVGLRLGAATLLATAASQWLKRRLSRPRPTSAIHGFAALAENPDAFSFPSGHTAAAFAAAVLAPACSAGRGGPGVGIGLSCVSGLTTPPTGGAMLDAGRRRGAPPRGLKPGAPNRLADPGEAGGGLSRARVPSPAAFRKRRRRSTVP
jgi:hypothetical protein